MKTRRLLLLCAGLLLASCGGTPVSSSASSLEASISSLPTSSEQVSSSEESEEPTSSLVSEESSPTESEEPAASSEEPAPASSEISSEQSAEPESEESILSSDESEAPVSSDSSLGPVSSEDLGPKEDPHELYGGYYASLSSWDNGEDLINQLHEIIHGGTYQPITYAGTYTNWFSNSDADQDLYVRDSVDALYTEDAIAKTLTTSSWQREHAWCASLMTGSTTGNAVKCLGRATDFHNLFASSTNGNTSRGNKNYGVANTFAPEYKKAGDYSYDAKTFEPSDYDKGRVARAIFYMATMYNEEEVDTYNGITMKPLQIVEENVDFVAGNDCAFAIGHLSELLSWSDLPVDYLEVQHNESVYSYAAPVHSHEESNVAQGNRNPYVDFPGLVDYAFGEKKNQPGSIYDVFSSHEELGMSGEGVIFHAVSELKRDYEEDEPFSRSDLSVVAVHKDLSTEPYDGFTLTGAEEGKPFSSATPTIGVITPTNIIFYDVKVETDPAFSATWNAEMEKKSGGGAFSTIYNQPGIAHDVVIGGLHFYVTWEKGEVSTTSSKYGTKFGANASSPVGTLTFETVDEFAYEDKQLVQGIYLRGAASSGASVPVDFYLGETLVATKSLGYDANVALTIGTKVDTPAAGKVKIVMRNITKAVYVQRLAIAAL